MSEIPPTAPLFDHLSERVLLSCYLDSPYLLDDPAARAEPLDFHSLTHRAAFEVMLELYEPDMPLAPSRVLTSLAPRLKAIDGAVSVETVNPLANLPEILLPPIEAGQALAALRRLRRQRQLAALSSRLAVLAYDGKDHDVDGITSLAIAALETGHARPAWSEHSVAELADMEFPPQRDMLAPLSQPIDGIGSTFGAAGDGKTTAVLHSAMRAGIRTYILAADSPELLLHDRVRALSRGLELDWHDFPIRCLHTPLDLANRDDLRQLERRLKQLEVQLLVVDSIASYLPAGIDENAAADVQRIMLNLRTLANCTGAAPHITHHLNRRTGEALPNRIRGSTAFLASVDQASVISTDGQGSSKVRTLAQVKNRFAPEADPWLMAFENPGGDTSIEVVTFTPGAGPSLRSTLAEMAATVLADKLLEVKGQLSTRDLREHIASTDLKISDRMVSEGIAILRRSNRVTVTKRGKENLYQWIP